MKTVVQVRRKGLPRYEEGGFRAEVDHDNNWTITDPILAKDGVERVQAIERFLKSWPSSLVDRNGDRATMGYYPCPSGQWAAALVHNCPESSILDSIDEREPDTEPDAPPWRVY